MGSSLASRKLGLRRLWYPHPSDRRCQNEGSGPSLCVECRDLAIAEADGVDFGCAVDVVLDHFLEMDVSKDDVDEAWLDVPWRVEDYGVFASHCEGVLD